MHRLLLYVCILPALAPLSCQAQSAPLPRAAQIDHGHTLFLADGCSQCHGTVGQGSRAAGPRLAPNTIPLDTFIQVLRKPRNEMPPYVADVLSDADADDIHAYLASIPAPKQKVGDIPALNR
jgi:mono/diheme cytochrome c family protein